MKISAWSELFVIANPGVPLGHHIVDISAMLLGDLNDSCGHTQNRPHYMHALVSTLS